MLSVTLLSGEIRLNSVSVWSAVKCQEQVVFYSGGSRSSDNGGGEGGVGGHPDPRDEGGGGRSQNFFFGPSGWIRHCLMYS